MNVEASLTYPGFVVIAGLTNWCHDGGSFLTTVYTSSDERVIEIYKEYL